MSIGQLPPQILEILQGGGPPQPQGLGGLPPEILGLPPNPQAPIPQLPPQMPQMPPGAPQIPQGPVGPQPLPMPPQQPPQQPGAMPGPGVPPQQMMDPLSLADPALLGAMEDVDFLGFPESFPIEDDPYSDPGRLPPDITRLRTIMRDTERFWSSRDQRMNEDLEMYRLKAPTATGKSGSVIIKNTPYVIVEKIANMVAAHKPVREVISASDQDKATADRLEQFLSWWWEDTDEQLRESQLYGSLRHVMAWFFACRGWFSARISIDPNATGPEDNPVRLTVYDPITVYPGMGRDGLRYVMHKYHTTVGELLDEWGDAAYDAGFGTKDPTDSVKVEAYYDDWWHAVWADDTLIKDLTPHEYGFVPWVVTVGSGSPVRMSESKDQAWSSEVGVSAFHSIRSTYLQLNLILSQMATEVERSANPPMIYYWDPAFGPKPQTLQTAPGAVNYLVYDRERAEPVQLTTTPRDSDVLLDSLVDDLQKGGLPSVLWGLGQGSGFQTSLMSDAARDQLFAIVEGMQYAQQKIEGFCLRLIRDFWQGDIGFWTRDDSGQWSGGMTISSTDIWKTGTKTKITYKDISPRDRIQLSQTGLQLREAGAIDDIKFLEDYVGDDNPHATRKRAMADMIFRNEDYMREVEIPLRLYETDKTRFYWYMSWLNNKKMTEQMAAMASAQPPMGGPMPPAPPGAPPGPGLPPPSPLMGLDPQTLLQQSMGSAIGGAGGGLPPGLQTIPGVPVGSIPNQLPI